MPRVLPFLLNVAAASAVSAASAASAPAAAPLRFPPSEVAARAAAARLGSFIADAAAMPLHWEYSQATIASKVGGGVPEFYSPPLNLWYKGV